MGLNEKHLKNLTDVKASLKTLSGSPVPAVDVANLNKKVELLIALLQNYMKAEAAIKKEHDAIAAVEAKLKADQAKLDADITKLAPKINNLNTMRNQLKDGAVAAYNYTMPMVRTLAKTPAYSKANDAVNKCSMEMLGTKDTYAVKLKGDGNFDI